MRRASTATASVRYPPPVLTYRTPRVVPDPVAYRTSCMVWYPTTRYPPYPSLDPMTYSTLCVDRYQTTRDLPYS